jgi:hypothetical protein
MNVIHYKNYKYYNNNFNKFKTKFLVGKNLIILLIKIYYKK